MSRFQALLLCIVALGIAVGAILRDSNPDRPSVHQSQSEKTRLADDLVQDPSQQDLPMVSELQEATMPTDEGRVCKICGG